jgi:Uma2 family endonuclease
MAAAPQPNLSPEEYLRLERGAETRSEFLDGEVFAMSGASEAHGLLVSNLIFEIRSRLRGKPCVVFPSDMRVRVREPGLYTYPDISIVCGTRRYADDHSDTLLNPVVIFEVLSPSTEAYDRGIKFSHYKKLPSLREYVLVSQFRPRTERFVNQEGQWAYIDAFGRDGQLELACLGESIPLSDVYYGIDFPDAPPARHS